MKKTILLLSAAVVLSGALVPAQAYAAKKKVKKTVVKKTQKTPQSEIAKAEGIRKKYFENKTKRHETGRRHEAL